MNGRGLLVESKFFGGMGRVGRGSSSPISYWPLLVCVADSSRALQCNKTENAGPVACLERLAQAERSQNGQYFGISHSLLSIKAS